MSEDLKKRSARNNKWLKENVERINLCFEKGTKARIDEACEVLGVSKSEFARQAISEKLEKIGV